MSSSRIRIIGLGNTLAGDDGAGVLVARRLKGQKGLGAEVVEAELAGLDVLEQIPGDGVVILVDAVRSGRPAGTIHRQDASATPIAGSLFPHSTHAFNAADALELGRVLRLLPPTVIVYGIEAGCVGMGSRLSPEVEGAVPLVAERVAEEVEALRRAEG